MKKYGIREIFPTLQGEGARVGSPAVFLRFAGCNLGYDVCNWCDTDWLKAHLTLSADELLVRAVTTANDCFGRITDGLLLVVTGGEPTLQFDKILSDRFRNAGFTIAMETNGSSPLETDLVDWVTVSPKQKNFLQRSGNELKIVFTGAEAPGIAPTIDAVRQLAEGANFDHYFLQPVDIPPKGPNWSETVRAVMDLGPPWRLSVQTHKMIGIA